MARQEGPRAGRWILLAASLAAVGALAFASSGGAADTSGAASQSKVGIPWTGERGITESVADIMARDALIPRAIKPQIHSRDIGAEVPLPPRRNNPDAPLSSQWPAGGGATMELAGPLTPQPIGPVNFKGISLLFPNESQFLPPDSMGDISPTQILVVANGRIKVFDRTGALGGLNANLDVFFQPVLGNGQGITDPQARYDRLSGRWFITGLTLVAPNRIVLAVSSGSVITNSSSFTFYFFQQDLVGPTPNHDTGGFADYDSLGVDRFALYVGANIYNAAGTAILGTTGFVVNKASLLAGTLTVTAFRALSDLVPTPPVPGPWSPRGVDNDDPAATQGFFIGVDTVSFSVIQIVRISDPGGTPSASGNLSLTTPTEGQPILVPHLGEATSRRRLDALDDRLFAARIHMNKLTGITSLWSAHNIQVNSSGVYASNGGRDGSRWYEIRNFDTTPTIFQSGTLFDSASSNPRFFWIPTVAMSGQGHMALGSSTAGLNFHADVSVAGRYSSDPIGTIQPFTPATASSSAYNQQAVDGQRWGDYSATNVDPTDDMTLWTFQEYCDGTNSWGVQVVQLLAPPPATPSSAAPATVCQGVASTDVVITGTSTSSSGFFDPGPDTGGPGYNRIAASVTGGVTVNGVTFTSPTQITLNVSTVGAAAGAQDVTVTNPDQQSRTGTGILSVTSGAATSASSNGPICAGMTLQLSATTVPGATYSWTGPNGFTSTQQNPSISGATTAASGVYSVTATVGSCASAPSTTTVSVAGNGGACSDGNPCTVGDTCQSGVCVSGPPRDADADTHVDALCGGDDCNDSNPLVWHAPTEATNLALTTASPADPAWDSQSSLAGPETVYDLVSGGFTSAPGINFAAASCLQAGGGSSFSDSRVDPALGDGYWYLARGRNSCGTGTYGAGRDATIPACP